MDRKKQDLKSFKEKNALLLSGIAHELNLYRNRVYEPYGITGKQAIILTFISFNSDKELTQKDFEQEFNLRPSTVNSLLNYLEDGGFLTRTVSNTDGRAKIITAEEKGKRLFDVILNCMQVQDDLIVKGFTEEEQIQLHSYLHRIMNNIHNSQEGAI